ncbi:type II toxin-antitoxin system RelE/ParE family toxin [Pseudomonas sp. NY15437]|uniref:type II toxin-antitoxin system RelE/ParE family toxin n=1 Tax=unclassified Pseudomonas TaxID=196821 RepID=UPI00223BF1A6|nr:type II toxin-antitoxin system RelE/ParE family toxin [Pseudomonas sp. GCEP-101]
MSDVTYEVLITRGAERDLEGIYDYIADFDCRENADYVLDQLLRTIAELVQQPQRGGHLRELMKLGIQEYRQVFFKPYRVIYRISDKTVHVHLVIDGRRDFQQLLSKRLLS